MGKINIKNGNMLTLYLEPDLFDDEDLNDITNIIDEYNDFYHYIEGERHKIKDVQYIDDCLNISVKPGYYEGLGITIDSYLIKINNENDFNTKPFLFDNYQIKCKFYEAITEAEQMLLNIVDKYGFKQGQCWWVEKWNDIQTSKINIIRKFRELKRLIKNTPCESISKRQLNNI